MRAPVGGQSFRGVHSLTIPKREPVGSEVRRAERPASHGRRGVSSRQPVLDGSPLKAAAPQRGEINAQAEIRIPTPLSLQCLPQPPRSHHLVPGNPWEEHACLASNAENTLQCHHRQQSEPVSVWPREEHALACLLPSRSTTGSRITAPVSGQKKTVSATADPADCAAAPAGGRTAVAATPIPPTVKADRPWTRAAGGADGAWESSSLEGSGALTGEPALIAGCAVPGHISWIMLRKPLETRGAARRSQPQHEAASPS
jgi:hypothetical protein